MEPLPKQALGERPLGCLERSWVIACSPGTYGMKVDSVSLYTSNLNNRSSTTRDPPSGPGVHRNDPYAAAVMKLEMDLNRP